jgi:transcriptional regulator with XRE-family HTH domain
MEVGQKIRKARLEKRMTQQELGDLVGVQKSAVAKYESGRVVNIKRSTLLKISKALGMAPGELITDISSADAANFHAKIISDYEATDMLEVYYKLNEENKKLVRNLVYKLKKSEE